MSAEKYAVQLCAIGYHTKNFTKKFFLPQAINTDYIFSTKEEAKKYAKATCSYLREINYLTDEGDKKDSLRFVVTMKRLPSHLHKKSTEKR